MVRLVAAHAEVGERGDRLEPQVGDGLRFLAPRLVEMGEAELAQAVARAPRRRLDPDLLGVGDHQVEAAAADHRDVTLAVAGEGDLDRRREPVMEARRQDPLVPDPGQLPETLDDGGAGREHQGVLDERRVLVGGLGGVVASLDWTLAKGW